VERRTGPMNSISSREFMGPVRLSTVEEAQHKIVGIIRRLEEAGEIVIGRGDSDSIIV